MQKAVEIVENQNGFYLLHVSPLMKERHYALVRILESKVGNLVFQNSRIKATIEHDLEALRTMIWEKEKLVRYKR